MSDPDPRPDWERQHDDDWMQRYLHRRQWISAEILGPAENDWWALEANGRLYRPIHGPEAEAFRRELRAARARRVIDRRGGEVCRRALQEVQEHYLEDQRNALLALLRDVCRFLLDGGHRDLLRLLYLRWRMAGTPEVSDLLNETAPGEEYHEGDEYRWLFGTGWRSSLQTWNSTVAAAALERAELDGSARGATADG